RPKNRFFIFLTDFHREHKTSGKLNGFTNSEITRIASNIWNSLTEDQQAPYLRRQIKEFAEHRKMYPGYRYTP
ncbi:high mobility group box domain-containing protein, partial [Hysterangium stoloniferum]